MEDGGRDSSRENEQELWPKSRRRKKIRVGSLAAETMATRATPQGASSDQKACRPLGSDMNPNLHTPHSLIFWSSAAVHGPGARDISPNEPRKARAESPVSSSEEVILAMTSGDGMSPHHGVH